MERLDKIVSYSLGATRSEAKKIIKSGKVKVSGEVCLKPESKAEISEVEIGGESAQFKEHIYIMLNKPEGIVSASEGKGQKTVVDLVPENLKRNGLFPAGRLDKDTVGFVLITDDGEFAHNILSPKKHIEKTYEAVIDGEVSEELVEKFHSGVVLYDGTECMSAELEVLEKRENPLVRIKIKQGKYHQIKRMFAVNGLHVLFLKRTAMGGLVLDEKLKAGECREITAEELSLISDKPKC